MQREKARRIFPGSRAARLGEGVISGLSGFGLCRIFAGLGENAMIARKCLTVFLYRKTKYPIYIYMAVWYYVFGEDWELSVYFRQNQGFIPGNNGIIYHFQLFLVFKQLPYEQKRPRV